MRRFRNAVGLKIRKFRNQRNLSQSQFAVKLQLAGLDLDRTAIAKIETQIRSVFDFELKIIADILGVSTDELFPEKSTLRKRLPELAAGKIAAS